MKPEWCPQWAWDKSDYLRQSTRETIARTLLDARQRGRREGMEEAIGLAQNEVDEARVNGEAKAAMGAKFVRDAIRDKMEEQP